jgi:ArsR family metal-binding transcriptional regulator
MLPKSYTKEIFNNECMPSAMTVQCFAHLEEDVSEALPYLNAFLGGLTYNQDPPSVTFKVQGKLITVHSKKIAINALKDEEEAIKIIEWLKREINAVWKNRGEIEPSYRSAPIPKIFEILKLLPKTNCRECGQTTCMVFASMVAEGAKGAEDCPPLDDSNSKKLSEYMSQFSLDSEVS